eukprot:XP_001696519.1 predicted protein [Chlamydomonas reinhardtii]
MDIDAGRVRVDRVQLCSMGGRAPGHYYRVLASHRRRPRIPTALTHGQVCYWLLSFQVASLLRKRSKENSGKREQARLKKKQEKDAKKKELQLQKDTDKERPPKVLVQLPMYNEEAHAAAIIQACCRIRYPRDRLLIQVLDDSTKEAVRQRVDSAAAACIEEGHPVQVMRRDNRSGFKAGAMVEGLNRVEGLGYEYCAIFDADFSPPADFLEETIPKVNLCFHFDVEQRARSYLGWFFNFNGTAGVWRIQSDTVVEDMDLSLRCYLRGWDALYLPHVDNPNELPCTLSSYKTQQFRWLSGPMQILIKSFSNIWHAKDIGIGRRLNAFWFFMRYVLFAAITVGVLAVPPVALYVTPFSIFYLFFSVAIGYFKLGLLGLEKSKTWKVTQKFGAKQTGGGLLHRIHKPYALETCLALYYGGMAAAAGVYGSWIMVGYCGLMTLVFLAISFGDAYM